MNTYLLKASVRTDLGRKVKKLRLSDQIPATIYGKNVKSVSVVVDKKAFDDVYGKAGETGLVELVFNDEKASGSPSSRADHPVGRQVLIHNVQVHPLTGAVLHVEFFQVDLKEKVKTRVPVEFKGESPIVAQKQGVLLALLDELEIEALPTDLPDKIVVDISVLDQVDKEIKAADLSIPSGVSVLTDASVGIVKVGPLVTKEAQAEEAAAQAAAAQVATTDEQKEAGTEAAKQESGEKVAQEDTKEAGSKPEPGTSKKEKKE